MTIRNPSHRFVATLCTAGFLAPLPGLAQPALLPGSPALVTNQLPGSSGAMHMTNTKPGDTAVQDVGTLRYERHLVPHVPERGGAPGILILYRGQMGGQPVTDSALILLHGLAPVWEVSRFKSNIDRFTYDGRHVSVVRSSPDSGERRIDHTYPVPFFMWQQRNELIAALPLQAGYRAILPLYSEGDFDLEMDTVQVVGPNADQRWTVRFADPVIVSTFEIDGQTRAITAYSHTMKHTGAVMRWTIAP